MKKILVKTYPDGLVEIYADPDEVYVKVMEVPSGLRGHDLGPDAYIPYKNFKFKGKIRLISSSQILPEKPVVPNIRKKLCIEKCPDCLTGWHIDAKDPDASMLRCRKCMGRGIIREWWTERVE